MLRASSTAVKRSIDARALTDPTIDANVEHGDLLTAFAEAVQLGTDEDCTRARTELRAAAGDAALVDACAIVAHFNMVTRMADGTGLPLDTILQLTSQDLQRAAGLRSFASAHNTAELRGPRRLLGAVLETSVQWIARWFGRLPPPPRGSK